MFGGGNTTNEFVFSHVGDGGQNYLGFTNKGASVCTTANGVVGVGQNYHVALTWDGIGTARIYVDGVEEASGTTTSPSITGEVIHIGSRPTPYGLDFRGHIDNFAFYDKELTAAEILAHSDKAVVQDD